MVYPLIVAAVASLWPYAVDLAVDAKAGVDAQIAFLEETNSSRLIYPTQFTQDIVPKGIHSHNDYWRDVPLLSALSYGVASVEADVWLWENELLVGHEAASLTKNRTFDNLYVQPLLQILKGQNPDNEYTQALGGGINGVFDTSSETSLNLLVEIKTNGHSTLPFVLDALKPLRDAGYLTTYYPNGTYITSAVTAIGTGNTPLDGIQALSPRDLFFDAPLTELAGSTTYNLTISPLASTDYANVVGWDGIGNISDGQLANLTKVVNDAHSLGIKARFWDTPEWPIEARNNVWKVLVENGADWLNADDIKAASEL